MAYSLLEKGRLREDEVLEIVSKTISLPDKTFTNQQAFVDQFMVVKNDS